MPGDTEPPFNRDDNLPKPGTDSRQQAQKTRADAALVYGVQSPVLSRIRNIQKNMRHALLEAGVTDPELLAGRADAEDEYAPELPPVIE